MKIELSLKQWDSVFFGFLIFSAELKNVTYHDIEELVSYCKNNKIRLVYLFPKDEVSAKQLENASIPLVDKKIIYNKTLFHGNSSSDNLYFYNGLEQNDALSKLVLSSGTYSRFKRDINFGEENFQRLYLTWLERSIKKEIADDVIVWKDTRAVVRGLITYKIKDEVLTIGLMSVDLKMQRSGVGQSLIRKMEEIALKRKIREITVATQLDNMIACKFYVKNNFSIKSIQPIYHLWITL